MSNSSSNCPEQSCDSKGIEEVRVYGSKWTTSSAASSSSRSSTTSSILGRLRWYHAVFGVLYIYQLGWVLSTTGEPYRLFLEKADREGFAGKSPHILHCTHCTTTK